MYASRAPDKLLYIAVPSRQESASRHFRCHFMTLKLSFFSATRSANPIDLSVFFLAPWVNCAEWLAALASRKAGSAPRLKDFLTFVSGFSSAKRENWFASASAKRSNLFLTLSAIIRR